MILVTGGTGLVGAHLLFQLAQSETPIKATYRSNDRIQLTKKVFSYYSESFEKLFSRITWIKVDITDIEALKAAFDSVSHVYHCAAYISFDPNDLKRLKKINVEGTANMVNLSLENNIEKFCYVSSIAALGSNQTSNIDEETDWGALNASGYSITKHQAEMEVWRGSQEGLKVVIVNPGVIIGPGFWHNGSGLFFKSIGKGMKYNLPGGTGFTTVNDVVNAMLILMNSEVVNENYIIVKENWTYKTFFEVVAKSMMKKAPKSTLSLRFLGFLWRLDWLTSAITGKKRRLSKASVASFNHQAFYNNGKISSLNGFQFESLTEVIGFVSERYLEEVG